MASLASPDQSNPPKTAHGPASRNQRLFNADEHSNESPNASKTSPAQNRSLRRHQPRDVSAGARRTKSGPFGDTVSTIPELSSGTTINVALQPDPCHIGLRRWPKAPPHFSARDGIRTCTNTRTPKSRTARFFSFFRSPNGDPSAKGAVVQLQSESAPIRKAGR